MRDVVEKSANRERLAVAQLHVGLGAARRERRNAEPGHRDAVREVERAHFRLHFHPDDVAGDRRTECQADAEFLVRDGDGAGQPLRNRHRDFAAGEKARLLTVVRNQRRLGEALKVPAGLQRLDDGADVVLRVEHEQVQEIAERQLAFLLTRRRRTDAILEAGSGELLRRRSSNPVLVAAVPREERGARFRDGAAIDLGDANLEHHLLVLRPAGQIEHVDHFGLRGALLGNLHRAQRDRVARHLPREHDRFVRHAHLDVFTREENLELPLQHRRRRIDHDAVLLELRTGPDEEAHVAGRFAVDEHLPRIENSGVGDDRVGDSDAGDRRLRLHHGRSARDDEQHRILKSGSGCGSRCRRRLIGRLRSWLRRLRCLRVERRDDPAGDHHADDQDPQRLHHFTVSTVRLPARMASTV